MANWEDKIEAYLEGDLSTEEIIAFEKELGENPSLQASLDLHKETSAMLDAFAESELAEQVKEIYASSKEEPRAEKENRNDITAFKRWIQAAAAILIIAAVFSILRPAAEENLYAAYYKAYEDNVTAMGSGNPLSTAMELYNGEDYAGAIEAFEEIPSGSEFFDEATLYKAVSLMEEKKFESAILTFDQLSELNSPYEEVGAWYKILSLLALDRISDAAKSLDDFIESDYKYKRNSALELKEKLE